jgi:hypothetical protein
MKSLRPLLALLAATPALTAELIYTPTAPAYTVVQIDSRKLKTTLGQALIAWPGLECVTPTDLNGVINCPGVTLGGINSYNINLHNFAAPQVTTIDNNGRVRTENAKVDGIKQKYWINATVVTTLLPSVLCPGGLTAIQQPPPPARAISVNPTVPLTEFGIEFGVAAETALTDIEVEVNGAIVGTYFVTPGTVQYIGVRAPEGITSVRFLPHDTMRGQHYGCNDSLTYEFGYLLGDRVFYQ